MLYDDPDKGHKLKQICTVIQFVCCCSFDLFGLHFDLSAGGFGHCLTIFV